MTNALIISVLISVPLSVNIISASSSSSYDMRYTSCSDEDSFLVLWNIPISQCVRECHARSLCAAVNYWTRSSGCELLSSHGGLKISSSSTGQPCVYARKPDNQVIDVCQNCDTASVCDATSGNCAIKECRKLHVENAIIKGNMLVVGSKAIVECLYGYTLDRSNPQVVCQANGTWGDIPRCVPEAEWSANDDCIYCVGFSVGCSSDWVHIGTSCYHTPGPLTTMWVFEAIVGI